MCVHAYGARAHSPKNRKFAVIRRCCIRSKRCPHNHIAIISRWNFFLFPSSVLYLCLLEHLMDFSSISSVCIFCYYFVSIAIISSVASLCNLKFTFKTSSINYLVINLSFIRRKKKMRIILWGERTEREKKMRCFRFISLRAHLCHRHTSQQQNENIKTSSV